MSENNKSAKGGNLGEILPPDNAAEFIKAAKEGPGALSELLEKFVRLFEKKRLGEDDPRVVTDNRPPDIYEDIKEMGEGAGPGKGDETDDERDPTY